MTTRTKEEQLLLDEKIARIQKKNEEILRRQKEIEEDKRLAEQQNAIVKLRPSTGNISRERTPALKPSKRELREDFSANLEEPVLERNTKGSFRGRGGDRYRGQGNWKTSGPPPDPVSFLYDDERDGFSKGAEGKGDPRKEGDKKRSDDPEFRDDNRRGREFYRGGRRGGEHYRTDRGRRGGGYRGRNGRNEEEAWRAERMKIDEARIQRQKSADGKWRREWDNEKITQESEEPRHDSRQQEQRRSHQEHHQQHHFQHHHQCEMHASSPGDHHHHRCHSHPHHHPPHDCPRHQYPNFPRGRGRGRGRLDPSELEKPIDDIPIEMFKVSSPRSPDKRGVEDQRKPKVVTPPSQNTDDCKMKAGRSIECHGDSFTISVPNASFGDSIPKPQRKYNEPRGRMRSQTSYSSQSEDESSHDRGQRGGRRQRNQKYSKEKTSHAKNSQEKTPEEKTSPHIKASQTNDNLSETTPSGQSPAQNKPPLPPLKSNQRLSSFEDKEGDDSWTDMTNSGGESMGEDLSSVHSSPGKNSVSNMVIVNSAIHEEVFVEGDKLGPDVLYIHPLECTDLDESGDCPSAEILLAQDKSENCAQAPTVVGEVQSNLKEPKTCTLDTSTSDGSLIDRQTTINVEALEESIDNNPINVEEIINETNNCNRIPESEQEKLEHITEPVNNCSVNTDVNSVSRTEPDEKDKSEKMSEPVNEKHEEITQLLNEYSINKETNCEIQQEPNNETVDHKTA